MAESANQGRRISAWAAILAGALGLRVIAAVVVTGYVARKGTLCVFGDTGFYWALARTIVAGETYVANQGAPHYALRTPGYPIFLALCRAMFGENILAVRLVQAALGTLVVWLVGRLVGAVGVDDEAPRGKFSIPIAAASLAAVYPYLIGLTVLVLSEATFLPMMMAGLWGLARLWGGATPRRAGLVAVGTGLAMGGAILSRPSWALFVPVVLLGWLVGAKGVERRRAWRYGWVVGLATAAVLTPWWVRNGRVIGRFVPTALWVGASLYDGIGPQATGASDMEFVDEPDVRDLGEVEQDAAFRSRAVAFARSHPGRVVELAWIKLGRFWSPWPNADTLQAPGVRPLSALVSIPLFALMAIGAFDRRNDLRALVLLAGPVLYFCALHLVFVSSIRYRIPGEVPAMGLAAIGLGRVLGMVRPTVLDSHEPPGPGGFDR